MIPLLLLAALAVDGGSLLESQPLRFEENGVGYVARGRGYSLRVDAARYELRTGTRQVTTRLVAARAGLASSGEGALPVQTHYFQGTLRPQAVRSFARVRTRDVHPGIDMVFHGRAGLLEYDFEVAPGADPAAIALEVEGARPQVNQQGDLEIGEGIRWKKPVAFQQGQPVECHYVVNGQRVRFAVGAYNPAHPLLIDPALAFASFAGRAGQDGLRGIGVDGSGNVYVAGTALSADLPRTVGPAFAGQSGNPLFPIGDAFVAKFSPAGSLLYLTYLGGDWEDCAMSLAVDRAGNAYVAGFSTSPNFPVTDGAFQRRQGGLGGSLFIRFGDAFVTKLNPTGDRILYSTLLGGARDDAAMAITIDGAGNAYIAGVTQSTNFPVSENAPQTRLGGVGGQGSFLGLDMPLFQTGDVFVAKLNAGGTSLTWSSYLGGAQDDLAMAIAIDAASNVYVAGSTLSTAFPTTAGALQTANRGFDQENIFFQFGDGFVTKFNAAGTQFVYSTLLGGRGDDVVTGIAVDATGAAIIGGTTTTRDLATTAGALRRTYSGPGNRNDVSQILGDGFVAKLNPAGSGLAFLSYVGAESDDGVMGLALDAAGNIYLTGFTQSPGWPVTADAAQARSGYALQQGGGGDAFLTVLDPNATRIVYSSFWGGESADLGLGIAVDASGNAYITGMSSSTGLRGTGGAFQLAGGGLMDGFAARFSGFGATSTAPVLRSAGNGASNAAGTVSPGMIYVAYGELLGPSALATAALDAGGRIATSRAGVTMRFDGTPAPVVYVSAGQVSGVVPYNVAGKQTVQLTLEYEGRTSAPLALRVAETAPALFSANSSGTGPAAALNQDGTFNSVTPAAPGNVVVLFGTGEGRTDPSVADGTVAASLIRPVAAVAATVGGQPATVLYAGAAPGNVVGLFQINVQLPAGLTGDLPVTVTVGGAASQAGVTISVR